ncbi:MAG: hypothetical protein KBT36_05875 [Kurthia sp.]|nr:hypothetical protein [Candidatus Kurthia equi]
MSQHTNVEVKKLSKRKKLLLGLIVLSLIEIIYFYFMAKPYNFLNGLDNFIVYIVGGNIAFYIAYFLLLEQSNIRKKFMLIMIGYVLLIVAPFFFHSKIPSTNMEDAQNLIIRSEGGKVVKDRDYANTIRTYEGQEVYLITIEKNKKIYRFAFDPENQRYYSF